MKKTVLRYGGLGVLTLMSISILSLLILGTGSENYDIGEVIGYGSIILSMVFIYLGIRSYRDDELNGNISFIKALQVGLLIALLPSFAFGAYNWVYSELIHPEFIDEYYEHSMQKMKASMSTEEFNEAVKKMEQDKAMFQNPFMQFFVMFMTVFIIGFIATVLSSLILKRSETTADATVSSTN